LSLGRCLIPATPLNPVHRFGTTKPGWTFLIDRALLAQPLEKVAAGEAYFFESTIRELLGNFHDPDWARACFASS